MKVGLEEMYKGGVRKLQMTRSVKCEKCSGSGSKSGKRYTCEVGGRAASGWLLGAAGPLLWRLGAGMECGHSNSWAQFLTCQFLPG